MLVGDKSQLVLWWLALARRMYQTDYIARTYLLCYSNQKLLRVPRRCFFSFASVFPSFPFALGRIMCIYVELFRLVTSIPRGAHDPFFFVHWFVFPKLVYVSLLAFVEKAVFRIGVLVGATSQHFVGPLGTEHIYRELCIVSWWEPHMCMSQPCVLAFGIHGRKYLFPGVCSS